MNIETEIRNKALKNGLLLGVILIFLSIISYYFIISVFNPKLLFLSTPTFSVILPIAVVILLCFSLRKMIGGYWNFKQATTGVFIMFLTAYLVQMIGRDVLFAKIIEPKMQEKMELAYIKAASSIKSSQSSYQKKMDQNIRDIKSDFEEQQHITTGRVIQSIAISIIFIFVFSLIFGVMFKNAEYVPVTEQSDRAEY